MTANGHSTSSDARDRIRAGIANSERAKTRSKVIDFFGQSIEIRQPTLGFIIDRRVNVNEDGTEEQQTSSVTMLIENAYVPGTDELVFGLGDTDWLKQLPFGDDIQRLITTITELTTVNPTQLSDDSDGTRGSSVQ
jgi:hypothetical protein